MFAKFNAVAALVLASMLVSVPVRAQVSGATLSGTVTDRSDTGVPNVTVSIKNTATGIAREVATDTAGFYSVPNLTPGVYEVSFSAAGFSTQVQTSITLTVGAQQTLNSVLKLGQVSERVVVTGAPTEIVLNAAVPYLLDDPEATAIPCKVVVGRSTLAVLPGIRV